MEIIYLMILGLSAPSFLRVRVLLLALVGFFPASVAWGLTVEDYEVTRVEGWTVRVEKSLAGDPRRARALALLRTKLRLVARAVPRRALPKLRQVTLWVSRDVAPGAAYHPSAEWLAANGRLVEMAGGVEFANIDHFLDWSKEQPWMVLHELAHAWHHRFLPGGYNHPRILAAYRKAVKGKKYQRVKYYNGSRRKAYAMTNPMEYFAELSEAYFGRNDFQPFAKKELKAFDPSGYRMVETVWGVKKTSKRR